MEPGFSFALDCSHCGGPLDYIAQIKDEPDDVRGIAVCIPCKREVIIQVLAVDIHAENSPEAVDEVAITRALEWDHAVPLTPAELAIIYSRLRLKGLSFIAMGERLNVSPRQIQRWVGERRIRTGRRIGSILGNRRPNRLKAS